MEKSNPAVGADEPLVTLVITPRETFSSAETSLRSILAITPQPFQVVYVDAGSPRHVQRFLTHTINRPDWRYLRFDHYLSPNQARNIGLREVKTKYVVFIDNDVVVAPGWLDALTDCAEMTGAGAVGPVYCIGREPHQLVHMAGGKARIEIKHGQRVFQEQHYGINLTLAKLAPTLSRQTIDTAEFHCMLVRMDVFERFGPLDEELLSAAEYLDICMLIREAGGEVFLEPRSVVTNLGPPPFRWYDLGFFLQRWSTEWNRRSVARFSQKWDLSPTDDSWQDGQLGWLEGHRRLYLTQPPVRHFRSALQRLWGGARQERVDEAIDRWVTRLLVP